MIEKEPGDLKTLRWWNTEAWRTGRLPEVPLQSRRQLSKKERDMIIKLRRKLIHRQGKAEIELCRKAMGEVGSLVSHENIAQAHEHLKEAKKCE